MNTSTSFLGGLLALVLGVLRLVWRLLVAALGLGLVLGLVLMGLAVWLIARLLGKNPAPVKMNWQRAGGNPFKRSSRPGQASNDADVVDVEAREVPAPNSSNATQPSGQPGALPGPHKQP